ncbi:MAG: DUF4397 domain-containing protein [Streptosporangiales bacterium]|nr:DUF4397 domain-containing protein [Streptosporangiales bacterium]
MTTRHLSSATPRTAPTRRIRAALLAAALAAAACAAGMTARTADAAETARITLIHGIPGFVADVALDGKTVLSGFRFQHVTDVLTIPTGKHRVQIYQAGTKTDPQLDTSLALKSGQDLSAVAAIGADGKPTAFVFDNHLPSAFRGPRAVVLRNAAAAGPVAVRIGGSAKSPVTVGKQGAYALPAGGERVRVATTAGDGIGKPVDVTLPAGRMYSIFVVGDAKADRLFLVTAQQRPAGGDREVRRIDTGGVPPVRSTPLGLAAAVLLAAGAVVVAAAVGVRRGHAGTR